MEWWLTFFGTIAVLSVALAVIVRVFGRRLRRDPREPANDNRISRPRRSRPTALR